MNHSESANKNQYIVRGDLFYADLSPVTGSEQGGLRPVLIIQNDTGNRHSPTVIAAAITSRKTKARIPTHVTVSREESGLKCDSTILLEQVRTIDRCRLKEYIGRLGEEPMKAVDSALLISLGLTVSAAKTTAVIFHASRMADSADQKFIFRHKECL